MKICNGKTNHRRLMDIIRFQSVMLRRDKHTFFLQHENTWKFLIHHSYLQENTPHIFQGCLHSRPIPIIMKFSVKQQLSPHSFSRLAFIFVRLQQSRGNLLQLRTKIFRLMKNIEWHYRKWCVRAERASQECKFENNGKFIFTDSSKRYRNVPKSTVKNGIQ